MRDGYWMGGYWMGGCMREGCKCLGLYRFSSPEALPTGVQQLPCPPTSNRCGAAPLGGIEKRVVGVRQVSGRQ